MTEWKIEYVRATDSVEFASVSEGGFVWIR